MEDKKNLHAKVAKITAEMLEIRDRGKKSWLPDPVPGRFLGSWSFRRAFERRR